MSRARANAFDESAMETHQVEWYGGDEVVQTQAVIRNHILEVELADGWMLTALNVDTIDGEYLVHIYNERRNVRTSVRSSLSRDDDECVWQVGEHRLRWMRKCAFPRKRKVCS